MVVFDYVSGEALEGAASDALTEASAEAAATGSGAGAVAAYMDGSGVWQYVREDEQSFHREIHGRDVRTVWVE